MRKHHKAKLKIGDPAKLHNDDRTDREVVIDIALQNKYGIISTPDVAIYFDRPMNEVRSYTRRICRDRYVKDPDFNKIINDIPGVCPAVYQLKENVAVLTEQELERIADEHAKKYAAFTTGKVMYSISSYSEENDKLCPEGYISVRDNGDIEKYREMLSKVQECNNKIRKYKIHSCKYPINRKGINESDIKSFAEFLEEKFGKDAWKNIN